MCLDHYPELAIVPDYSQAWDLREGGGTCEFWHDDSEGAYETN